MKQKTRRRLLTDIYYYFCMCISVDMKADFEINVLLEDLTENKYRIPYDFEEGWSGVFSRLTNSQLRHVLTACKNSGILERAQKRKDI